MLASWPGIGNVAIIVATYLERKLDFKELGEVEAFHFLEPYPLYPLPLNKGKGIYYV